MQEDYQAFFDKLNDIELHRAMPMKTLTSFHIGGPANVIFPVNEAQLLHIMRLAWEMDIQPFIMGNGSNLLVSDKGMREPVVCLNRCYGELIQNGSVFIAPAGMLLSAFAKETVRRGFTGLEWANGIPGTIGGAIAMNAGAYGGEIKQVIKSVKYFENGELRSAAPKDGELSYRKSAYSAPTRICVSAEFILEEDSDGSAASRMQDFALRRTSKQPLKYPSAGSVFKRPEGAFAGALIEQAGLKGISLGGAQVSEQHAGFIINTGNASCNDVLELIALIQSRVFDKSGIMLEPEIKLIGMEA